MGRHQRRTAPSGARTVLATGSAGAAVLGALAALAAPASAAPATTSATPCAATAKACVDISQQKAWLTDGAGHVVFGAVDVTTGAPGTETPTGTFGVMWKDADHKSGQYDGSPMDNSVFFAPGDAFHAGSLQRDSAGCVHLSESDSKRFFDYLQVYDQVQIVP